MLARIIRNRNSKISRGNEKRYSFGVKSLWTGDNNFLDKDHVGSYKYVESENRNGLNKYI